MKATLVWSKELAKKTPTVSAFPTANTAASDAEQLVGRERRERELIADFQLPIVDLNSRCRLNSAVRHFYDTVSIARATCG